MSAEPFHIVFDCNVFLQAMISREGRPRNVCGLPGRESLSYLSVNTY
jgi:hypothetical protein